MFQSTEPLSTQRPSQLDSFKKTDLFLTVENSFQFAVILHKVQKGVIVNGKLPSHEPVNSYHSRIDLILYEISRRIHSFMIRSNGNICSLNPYIFGFFMGKQNRVVDEIVVIFTPM